jgi:hypothetical protein
MSYPVLSYLAIFQTICILTPVNYIAVGHYHASIDLKLFILLKRLAHGQHYRRDHDRDFQTGADAG